MKTHAFPVLVTSILVACSGSEPPKGQAVNRDTLTQRQKDSILAHSKIPNAGAVGRAMTAADSTSARIQQANQVGADTNPR